MGYSQRAAYLTVRNLHNNPSWQARYDSDDRRPARSLTFQANLHKGPFQFFSSLAYEAAWGGFIYEPSLFNYEFELFKAAITKVIKKKQVYPVNGTSIVRVHINFMVLEDEEYFTEGLYRTEQEKLFSRLTERARASMNKLNEESILICASGIAENVILFK